MASLFHNVPPTQHPWRQHSKCDEQRLNFRASLRNAYDDTNPNGIYVVCLVSQSYSFYQHYFIVVASSSRPNARDNNTEIQFTSESSQPITFQARVAANNSHSTVTCQVSRTTTRHKLMSPVTQKHPWKQPTCITLPPVESA